MKILFNDLSDSSTVSCNNASPNYPIENIQDAFIKVRYQSATNTDTIRYDLESVSSINCIFYYFTNADSIEFKLYNSSDVLLYTETIASVENNIDSFYFSTIDNVSYITCELSESIAPYMGKISFGQYKEMKNLSTLDWAEPMQDNSVITTSPAGSVLQNYVEPLEGFTFTFKDYTREEMNEIKTLIKSIGIGKGVFVDITESNHNFIDVMFSYLTATISPTRNGRRYDFILNLMEAR